MSHPYTYISTHPPRPCTYKPILHTARLTLTIADPLSPAHLAFTLVCLNDPTARARMGDYGIRTPAQLSALNAATQLLPVHTPLNLPTSGPAYYIIRLGSDADGESGEPMGIVSLASRTRSVPPDMGWLLLSAYHGRGYAAEACGEFLRYFLDEFQGGMRNAVPMVGIIAWPKPSNLQSVRLAERLGMVEMGEVDGGEGGAAGSGNVVYVVPGLGINRDQKFNRRTVVDFYGEGKLGARAKMLIEKGSE